MPAESPNLPPYVGLGVFKSTTETLRDTTVPSGPLDRRVLHDLSGADYGALISALKFFGFVDGERKATPAYRAFIDASKDQDAFKDALYALISEKYKPIVGNLDFKTGTASQFEKAFRDAGVSPGQMLTKTLRFYVKALAEAGQEISQHITKPRPRTPRSAAKPRARTEPTVNNGNNGGGSSGERPPVDSPPQGFSRMPIPGIPDGFVQYPANLTETQCEMYEAVVSLLRTYAKGIAGGKGATT